MVAHFMMKIEFLQLEKEFEETIEFCKSKKADKIEQIGLLERVYENITDYNEKEALISRLKKGVRYYEELLELLFKLRQKSEDSSDGLLDLDCNETQRTKNEEDSRDPMDMLRFKYKQAYDTQTNIVNMKDLLEWFFDQNQDIGCIPLEDIAEILYETRTPEEFKKAKNSIAAQLRRGAEEGRWQKIGRGHFAPINSISEENQEHYEMVNSYEQHSFNTKNERWNDTKL